MVERPCFLRNQEMEWLAVYKKIYKCLLEENHITVDVIFLIIFFKKLFLDTFTLDNTHVSKTWISLGDNNCYV